MTASVLRRDHVLRLFVGAVLSAMFVLSPLSALAAPAVTIQAPVLSVADASLVSRGEFIRAAIKALHITVDAKSTKKLSYPRVPVGLRPYIELAKEENALKLFGNDLQLKKAITRGEAAYVLAELLDDTSTVSVDAYADVRTPAMKKAVALMLGNKWMKPVSDRMFGVQRPLKGSEARKILRALDRESGDSGEQIQIESGNGSIPKEDTLKSVYQLLQHEYLYKDRLDGKKAMDKSIKGLVESLNDPYTIYMPPASSQSFQDQIRGEVEGIGATVEQTGGLLRIVSPLKGSPAERAGLLPKDQLISADGVSLNGLSLDEAVSKIRGPKGTTVRLTVRRDGRDFDVSVTRDKVSIPETDISMQEGIAVVKIEQFGQTTDTTLRPKLQEAMKQNPKGVILDLRNNPGGLLHAAGTVVGYFLPKGSAFVTITGRDQTYTEKTEQDPIVVKTIPVVVIVNSGSASASEIVAGALQDAKRATLIGQKTYGKGTVQQVIQFPDGSSLKMTIAEWHTPSGRKIDGTGVTPDETVDQSETRDDQLQRALQILR